MVKDKDKLFIECECVDRCAILTLEYLKCCREFFFGLYRLYKFKRRKEIYDISFTKDDARNIIEYFQKKPEDRKDIFIECKSSNISGGITVEWIEMFDMHQIGFYRKYRFNLKKKFFWLTFSKDQAQQIVDYLQKKIERSDKSEQNSGKD